MFIPAPAPKILDPYDNEAILNGQRDAFMVPVRQPLLLISQIQRSGGSLLTQLLDGHPQLHVHPSELHIGRPNKYFWPKLNLKLAAADVFFDLCEHTARLHATEGYAKEGAHTQRRLPFVFCATLQARLFGRALGIFGQATQRAVLDAYATSYFNAWLDYQMLYRDPAQVKYWVSFVARLAMAPQEIKRYFSDYPDGLLVSVVRDPVSWYASASRYMPERYGNVDTATALWLESTQVALFQYQKRKKKVLLLSFEQLVRQPLPTLRKLYRFAGLDDSAKQVPTFNGIPMEANSSFVAPVAGAIIEAADRTEHVLPEDREVIEARCRQAYEAACAVMLV